MPKRKTKAIRCGKGWFPVEVKRGKKKMIVCGRVPKGCQTKKGKLSDFCWYALHVANNVAQGLMRR
jgi:hypothetical protein